MKILAATDGSRASRGAVRFAARLAAGQPHSKLTVLTVGTLRHDLMLTGAGVAAALGSLRELEGSERRAAQKILENAAREAQRYHVRARLSYCVPKSPMPAADAIAREADRAGADLIVVGSEGHSALASWALGSVTQRLVSIARRPVTIVRPRRRR